MTDHSQPCQAHTLKMEEATLAQPFGFVKNHRPQRQAATKSAMISIRSQRILEGVCSLVQCSMQSDLVSEQVSEVERVALQRRLEKECFKSTARWTEILRLYLDAGFSPYCQVFGLNE